MKSKKTLQILIITMLVALLFINIFTFKNVSYVRAESATTATTTTTTDISNNVDISDIDNTTIQEYLKQINTDLSYMMIIQIISLGAFLGYVAIDRLR